MRPRGQPYTRASSSRVGSAERMPVQTLLHTTGSTMSSEMNTGSQSRAIHTSASTTNDATGVDLTTVMSGHSSASAVFDAVQATASATPSATAAVMPSSTRPMDTAVMRQNAAVAASSHSLRTTTHGAGSSSSRFTSSASAVHTATQNASVSAPRAKRFISSRSRSHPPARCRRCSAGRRCSAR